MSQNISRAGTDSAVTTKKPLNPRLQALREKLREESRRNLEERDRQCKLEERDRQLASQARMEEELLRAQRLQRALEEENPRPSEKPTRLRLPLRDLFFPNISRAGEILIDLHLLNERRKG